MPDRVPLLPRLDPATRKPLKHPPRRPVVIDLAEGKPLKIWAASVVISRGELRALDSDGQLCASVCSGAWRSWHFESVEVTLPGRHRVNPGAIT